MEKKHFTVTLKSVTLLAIIVLVSACNKNTTRIKVDAASYGSKELVIEEQRVDGVKQLESVILSANGKASRKFDISQPIFYNLTLDSDKRVFLLLKPADQVKLVFDDNGIDISGSDESEQLNELYANLFSVREQLDTLEKQYRLSIDTTVQNNLSAQYDSIIAAHYKYSVAFVLKNLTSLTSVSALYQELSPNAYVFGGTKDLQFFKLVSDSLIKYYPKNRHVLALQRNFNTMYSNYNVDRILKTVEITEQDFPDVKLPDMKGDIKVLSELKQRYVLLNIWASGDQISHQLFPEFNTIYNKYKNKNFTIYNVYLGRSLEDWSRIVNYEEINDWVNVADTSFPNSALMGNYNIQDLPTNYLIDRVEKRILVKDIPPTQLNQKLSKLLN